MADGSVRLVGFVSRQTALALRAAVRDKGMMLTLYNFAWAAADYLVAVPLSEIATIRDLRLIRAQDRETLTAFDIELR